ncbi:hypothetical protein C8J33_1201 [Rhizobium sp. PP-CC-3G-465]|nr:hypothetical protein C8J33_1201 [Rhizobium sp. PP-CC-3G-465]
MEKPRPEGRGFASLRLAGISGLAIELDLIGEFNLGEERKHGIHPAKAAELMI